MHSKKNVLKQNAEGIIKIVKYIYAAVIGIPQSSPNAANFVNWITNIELKGSVNSTTDGYIIIQHSPNFANYQLFSIIIIGQQCDLIIGLNPIRC